MLKSNNIKLNSKLILALLTSFIIICLVINPSKYITVCLNGILVFCKNILPALLPFIFFTKLLTSTGYVEFVSNSFSAFTKKMYNTPAISSYVFLMSILSGYPIGAKITTDLFEAGLISREEAHRICSYSSNSGPMFIVGTVGVGMFGSIVSGYIILFSHITASLLNGLIYRKYQPKFVEIPKTYKKEIKNTDNFLSDCMENSIMSVLMIGGFIAISFIIIEVLNNINFFSPLFVLSEKIGINSNITKSLVNGAVEITNGCCILSNINISLKLKTILASFIISFGGLSVAFQGFVFLNKLKISKKFYFLQKFSHALIATLLSVIICLIFKI